MALSAQLTYQCNDQQGHCPESDSIELYMSVVLHPLCHNMAALKRCSREVANMSAVWKHL